MTRGNSNQTDDALMASWLQAHTQQQLKDNARGYFGVWDVPNFATPSSSVESSKNCKDPMSAPVLAQSVVFKDIFKKPHYNRLRSRSCIINPKKPYSPKPHQQQPQSTEMPCSPSHVSSTQLCGSSESSYTNRNTLMSSLPLTPGTTPVTTTTTPSSPRSAYVATQDWVPDAVPRSFEMAVSIASSQNPKTMSCGLMEASPNIVLPSIQP